MTTTRQRTITISLAACLLLLSVPAQAFITPQLKQQKQRSISIAAVSRGASAAAASSDSYYEQGWKNIPDPVFSTSTATDPVTPPTTAVKVEVPSQLQESASQLANSVKAAASAATDAMVQQQLQDPSDAASPFASMQSAAQEGMNTAAQVAQDRLSTVNLQSSARAVLENAKALAATSSNAAAAAASGGSTTPAAGFPRDPSPAFTLPEPMPLQHPDFDQILANAPDTPGLAQPLVQYVLDTLYDVKDSPANPPHVLAKFAAASSQDFSTVGPLGLQVKNDLLESMQTNAHTVEQAANYFTTNLAASYDVSSHRLHDMADTSQHAAAAASKYLAENTAASYANSVSHMQPAVLAAQTSARQIQLNAAASASVAQQKAMESAAIAQQKAMESAATLQSKAATIDTDRWPQLAQATAAYVTEQLERLVATMVHSSGTLAAQFPQVSNKLLAGAALGLVVLVTLLQQQQQQQQAVLPSAKDDGTVLTRSSSSTTNNNNNDTLEGVVADLTQAVAILANELKDIKENQQSASAPPPTELATKLLELEAQNVALRSQLNAAQFEVETLAEVNEALNVGNDAMQSLMAQQAETEKSLANAYFVLTNNNNNINNGATETKQVKRKRGSSSSLSDGLAEA